MNNKWQVRFMNLALHVSTWSKDPSRKVGAVITDDKNRVLSLGFNGFPRGVDDHEDRYADRETKLSMVQHAERNALDLAPHNVEGATLYSTLYPCAECAKSIIQRGIKTVVVPGLADEKTVRRFNMDVSATMLQEAGVDVIIIDYEEDRQAYHTCGASEAPSS